MELIYIRREFFRDEFYACAVRAGSPLLVDVPRDALRADLEEQRDLGPETCFLAQAVRLAFEARAAP